MGGVSRGHSSVGFLLGCPGPFGVPEMHPSPAAQLCDNGTKLRSAWDVPPWLGCAWMSWGLRAAAESLWWHCPTSQEAAQGWGLLGAAEKEVSQRGGHCQAPCAAPTALFTPQRSWSPSVTPAPTDPRAAPCVSQHLLSVPQGPAAPRVTSAPSLPQMVHTGSPTGCCHHSDVLGGQSPGSAAAQAPAVEVSRARGAKVTTQLCKEPTRPWRGQGVIKSFQHFQP